MLADLVKELGRERSAADSRSVGLDDPEHIVDSAGAEAGTCGDAACNGIGGGHIRIGSLINVEERALGSLEKNLVAVLPGISKYCCDVRNHGDENRGVLLYALKYLIIGDLLGMIEVLQDEVVVLHDGPELLGETVHIAEIADAEAPSCGLVLVRGADALAGGSDLLVTECSFPCVVNDRMVRQDQRAGLRDLQAAFHIHTGALELAHLLEQCVRREDDA